MVHTVYTNSVNHFWSTDIHIAVDENYVGCLKSYSRLTGLITALFGISQKILLNNQEVRVNKNQYIRMLQSLGLNSASRKTIGVYNHFNSLNITPPSTQDFLRNHISPNTAYTLGTQLVKAIVEEHNVAKAKDLLGMGASVDLTFCTRSSDGNIVFGDNPEAGLHLPETNISPIEERRYTPLLFAADHNPDIRDLLLKFGANTTIAGMQRIFRREIVKTTPSFEKNPVMKTVGETHVPTLDYTSSTVVARPNFYHHHGRYPHRHGPGYHLEYVPPQPFWSFKRVDVQVPAIEEVKKETNDIKDIYYDVKRVEYDSNTGRTTLVDQPSDEHTWSSTHVVSRNIVT